jgi:superfamily II DNA/RNA helicase
VSALQEGNMALSKYVRNIFSSINLTHPVRSVQHLVLDEADRMLDAEFMEQIQEIVATCSNSNVRKALFSATLPAGAEKIAMSMLENPIRIVVGLKYAFFIIILG